MIKITSELKTSQGFKSSISVLEISSYTVTETVQLTTGSTMPMASTGGKNININFQVYKSLTDKNAGSASYQPIDFPYSYSIQPAQDVEINESYLYDQVRAKLNDAGYNTEFA